MTHAELNPRFPYVTGGTLPPNAASYVERKADYDLLAALIDGEYCYLLDTRQMGKSSLMVRTGVKLREHGVDTVVLDLSALGQNVTPDRWYAGLLTRLGTQLDIEDALVAYWRERQELGGLQRFVEGVRKALLLLDRSLVIFLDEIDAVRSLPFSTDEFFIAIRECYNRRTSDALFERLTFCLMGVATPTDLIQDTRVSPFNIGRRIVLEDFTLGEAALLAQGLAGKTPVLERVLFWTGGHPYLTQKLCRVIAEESPSGAPGEVDRLCAELFLTPQAREADDNLAFVRNRLLQNEVDSAALLELYGRIWAGKRVPDEATNPLCSVVKLSGAVRVEHGALRVRNRIYAQVFDRAWVSANRPGAEVRRQRYAFRRGMGLAGATAGVVLALIGGLAVMAVQNARRANQQAEMARVERYQAERERDIAQNLVYVADMKLIQESYDQNDFGRVRSLLYETRDSRSRGFEWGYWNRLCHLDLLTLQGHGRGVSVQSVAFSSDGKQIVTGNANGTAHVRDAATGRDTLTLGTATPPSARYGDNAYVQPVAFSPDGKRILTGTGDGGVKVWDTATGHVMLTLQGQSKPIYTAVAFSRDGKRIFAGGRDGTAKIWDATTGRTMLTLQGQGKPVYCAAFSSNGERLATASDDGLVKIWDVATGREALTITVQFQAMTATAMAFSPDGKRIVVGNSSDTPLEVFDTASSVETLVLPTGHFHWITSVVFSPDGKQIVAGCGNYGWSGGVATVWDAVTGHETRTLRGHDSIVSSVAFSPDGKQILTGSADGTAKVWDATLDRETLPLPVNSRAVWSAHFSPDGKHILTGTWEGSVTVWDTATRRKTLTLSGNDSQNTLAVFSPDGKQIVTGSADGPANVWDATTGRKVLTLKGHAMPPNAIAVSPDGKRILSCSMDGSAIIWDAATGHRILTLLKRSEYMSLVAFSPDGRRIVTGGRDGTAQVLDPTTGRATLTLIGNFRAAAFSPDGTQIFTGGEDHTARVWDAATGRELLVLKGHSSAVDSVAVSSDGKRFVTGSFDGTAKVWDAVTGRETLTLKGHNSEVNSVAFSPDGKSILTGSMDGTARLWSADTGR